MGFKNYEALINNMNYTKDSDIIDDEFSVFNISKHKNNFNNNIKKSKKLKDGILTTEKLISKVFTITYILIN